MKKYHGMLGLTIFVGCLWAVIVTTYADQIYQQAGDGKSTHLLPQQDASCSSTTSSGGE